MSISVLLADDHRLIREALKETLARVDDIVIVGEAGNGAQALDGVFTLDPDVLVLDIGLPDINGIEVATRLKEARATTRVVALSAYVDKRFVKQMLHAGASAFVSKSAAPAELETAIRSASIHQSYFSTDVAAGLAAEFASGGAAAEASAPRLAPREREVLRLVAEGKRTIDIAEALHIAPGTVEVHRRNISRKLGLKTLAEMVRYAVREGMTPP